MNRNDLIQRLNHVKPFLMAQDFIPILNHFCFDGLYVSAYNDVAGIFISMESDLQCAVPGNLLLKMLSTMTTETVQVEMPTERNIKLTSGKTNIKLPVLPPEEFVFKLPDTTDIEKVRVPKTFLRGLKKCLISVGQDPSHPEQTGISWFIEHNKISIYSTNDKSISKFSVEGEDVGFLNDDQIKVIIPAFFCEEVIELTNFYAENDDYIDLYIKEGKRGDNFVVAEIGTNGSCKIFTRLINGEFMNFESVITRMLEGTTEDTFVDASEILKPVLERAVLLLSTSETLNSTEVSVEDNEITFLTETTLGRTLDVVVFPKPLGVFRFSVDPSLIQNGFKVTDNIAILSNLIVLTSEDRNFIHLISHSNTGV